MMMIMDIYLFICLYLPDANRMTIYDFINDSGQFQGNKLLKIIVVVVVFTEPKV